ncbi:MAG: TIGR03086 family metal-binding protein [Ilumatobacter sp.]|uniref:TIGR03086 family metal-binding protein n=1 Tax=Ilumatobacter sp. TaxID=1967498 RepID=UPI002620B0F2|nr:TIGR03086 family metal-binding protein [Ilumatobacter sp.]MDJ0771130.1 TIGR03086 family metal-binding protein [Ilumatobacter sp.]
MSENLRNFTKALYGFDAVVQRVRPDQWDADTPCEGWCARDLVAHECGVIGAVAQMAETGEIAMPTMPHVGDDPVGHWDATRDRVLEALDTQGALHTHGNFWWGEMSIDQLVAFATWDPLAHSWDLAEATGQEAHADEGVAEAALATIAPMSETLRKMRLTAEPVDVPDDADAMTRFLGLTGRNPR